MKIMPKPILDKQLKAIANAQRLMILDWLKDPTAHFRPQIDGDLVTDGVCALLIGTGNLDDRALIAYRLTRTRGRVGTTPS